MSASLGSGTSVVQRQRRVRVWDVLLTVLLLIGMLAVGIWGAFYGALSLAFMDTCPDSGCDGNPIYLRWLGGAILGLVALVTSIVLLVLRRRAWWVALLGMAAMFALWSDFLVAAILYSAR